MTPFKLLLFGKDNRIGRRLIVYVIAFSTLITLGLSAIQLAFEYRGLRTALARQFDSIAIYVPAIEGSVWDFDDKQIQREIDALTLLPNVVLVTVATAEGGKRWTAGRAPTADTMARQYALRHADRGQDTHIGTLEVVASLDAIHGEIVARTIAIIISTGLQIFLVALFMVALIRQTVTTRLEAMAGKVRKLIPSLLPQRQVVEAAPPPIPEALDELAAVDWALDRTSKDLDIAVGALRELNEHLEQTVQERTHELEAAIEELKAFSYTLSHDMRAPLRAMSGYSKILTEDYSGRLGEEGQRHLDHIAAAAERMDTLITDTLGLYRVSASTFKRDQVDLGRIAREIAEQLMRSNPGRRVDWQIADDLRTEGDAGLLRTALENLIGNAWKYSSKREHSQIAVGKLAADDGSTIFYVKDNGAGFDMAYADLLFKPFQRLHSQAEFPGNGVGLATVRKIVARHEGRIWAESAVEQGTSFYFTLAAAQANDD